VEDFSQHEKINFNNKIFMDTSKTVFIADDDEDDIFFFNEAVKEVDNNVELIVAKDGLEAMNILKDPQTKIPHYIFLDLNMPKKSGKQCLIEIRSEDKFHQVPVIIYTTSSSEEDEKETLLLGADYFITKFKTIDELRNTLAELLKNGRM